MHHDHLYIVKRQPPPRLRLEHKLDNLSRVEVPTHKFPIRLILLQRPHTKIVLLHDGVYPVGNLLAKPKSGVCKGAARPKAFEVPSTVASSLPMSPSLYPCQQRGLTIKEHTALRRDLLQKVLRYLFILPRQGLYEIDVIIRRRLLDVQPLEPKRHVGQTGRTFWPAPNLVPPRYGPAK